MFEEEKSLTPAQHLDKEMAQAQLGLVKEWTHF